MNLKKIKIMINDVNKFILPELRNNNYLIISNMVLSNIDLALDKMNNIDGDNFTDEDGESFTELLDMKMAIAEHQIQLSSIFSLINDGNTSPILNMELEMAMENSRELFNTILPFGYSIN